MLPADIRDRRWVLAELPRDGQAPRRCWAPAGTTAPACPDGKPAPLSPDNPGYHLLRGLIRPAAQQVILALYAGIEASAHCLPVLTAFSAVPVTTLLKGTPGVLFGKLVEDAVSDQEFSESEPEDQGELPSPTGHEGQPEPQPASGSSSEPEPSTEPEPGTGPSPDPQLVTVEYLLRNMYLPNLAVQVQDQPADGDPATWDGAALSHLPLRQITEGTYTSPPGFGGPHPSFQNTRPRPATDPPPPGKLEALGDAVGLREQVSYQVPDPAVGSFLYLDDLPGPNDIGQGQFGDCYFLAMLATVARHDPGQILRLLESNGRFRVRFWRQVILPDGGPFTLPQWVTVSGSLACAGLGEPRKLAGARPRADTSQVTWSRHDISGADPIAAALVKVRTAAWAAVLEKAFAGFVARFGLSDQDPDTAPALAGEVIKAWPAYHLIGKGIKTAHPLYRIIYGPRMAGGWGLAVGAAAQGIWATQRPAAADGDTAIRDPAVLMPATADTADADFAVLEDEPQYHVAESIQGSAAGPSPAPALTPPPGTALDLVDPFAPADADTPEQAQACRLAGVLSRLQHQAPGDAALVLCTASTDGATSAWRLIALLAKLPAGAWSAAAKQVAAATEAALPTRPFTLDEAWGQAAAQLLAGLEPLTHDGDAQHGWLAARVTQLLLTGRSQNTRRYVIPNHAYALLEARLVVTGEGPLPSPVTPGDLARIDDAASAVTLRNPHHRDSPDPSGTARRDDDNGEFTLTLRDFLAVFTDLEYAVIQAS